MINLAIFQIYDHVQYAIYPKVLAYQQWEVAELYPRVFIQFE
jgi:hypothetical protein